MARALHTRISAIAERLPLPAGGEKVRVRGRFHESEPLKIESEPLKITSDAQKPPHPDRCRDPTSPRTRGEVRTSAPFVVADALATPAMSTDASPRPVESRWRGVARTAFPFLVVGVIWEVLAHSGLFPPRLFPPVETIAAAFVRLTVSGVLLHHTLDSLVRLVSGFALAAIVGVTIGIAMGRSQFAEDVFLPLVSIGAPIPGLAYAPLFLLWFGLGNVTAVLLVGFVSAFPIVFNTWTGVKAVKEIWVRAAQAMGAGDRALFRLVILPGALPYILTGLRLGLAQAWRILVGVEMLAAVQWGLGWLIFGAREFLATDVMLSGIIVIALIGLALEKLVFQRVEEFTLVRWGMLT
jgi:NitT/TauT family transport system permease protein